MCRHAHMHVLRPRAIYVSFDRSIGRSIDFFFCACSFFNRRERPNCQYGPTLSPRSIFVYPRTPRSTPAQSPHTQQEKIVIKTP